MDPHSRTLEEEEHLDHSRMGELGHTHMQVAEAGRYLAEDTVQVGEPEHLDSTGMVAHTFVTEPAAETAGPAGDSNQILGEVKAVVMDVAMGD